ncbi:hypothetical protein, partial [Pasteurella multocida]
RDTAEALQKQDLKHTEILPLFARLSAQEQNKIFHPSGLNRIVRVESALQFQWQPFVAFVHF